MNSVPAGNGRSADGRGRSNVARVTGHVTMSGGAPLAVPRVRVNSVKREGQVGSARTGAGRRAQGRS